MKVKTIKELEGTERHIKGVGFDSIRVLLEKDGMGFSLHKTIIPKGDPQHWHYKHHLESCYCIKGSGIIKNLTTKESYPINVDSIYILDSNDDHTFQALEDVVLISVFNPPVSGNEIHDESGSYLPSHNKLDKINKIVDVCNNTKNDYDLRDELKNII